MAPCQCQECTYVAPPKDLLQSRQEKLREIFKASARKPGESDTFEGTVGYWLVKILPAQPVVSFAGGLVEYGKSYFYGTRAEAHDFGEDHPSYTSEYRRVSVQRATREEILAHIMDRQREIEAMQIVLQMGE